MMLEELCRALGWQGGTRHQVLEEIARLRKAERLLRTYQDRARFEANSESGFVSHVDRFIGTGAPTFNRDYRKPPK